MALRNHTVHSLLLAASVGMMALQAASLQQARDQQDRAALNQLVTVAGKTATAKGSDAEAQYQLALAQSTLAEVAMELRDKAQARTAAENGIAAAQKATSLHPEKAEYHRVLGTLCGQAAAAIGGLSALKYGKCALDEVNKAIQLDPKSPMNHLSHGVGNYYLPAALGGGVELAMQDFQKAIALDGNLSDAHLWMGLALKKVNRSEEARTEFKKAVQLNPARVWAQQQLSKAQ
jgi:tetratricopeptide (TPR) repeat protein